VGMATRSAVILSVYEAVFGARARDTCELPKISTGKEGRDINSSASDRLQHYEASWSHNRERSHHRGRPLSERAIGNRRTPSNNMRTEHESA
jgi:hypothetical protein